MDLKQFKTPFLKPALICVVVVLPLFVFGLHDSTDLYQHIQFASSFHHSILNGELYPSWSEEENFGYGSVGMRFYPPLFQFLIALVRTVTGDWHSAICVVLFAFWFSGAYGIYLWAKEFISDKEAAVSSIAFLLMPYLLSQVYTSAFYAQSCAVSVLPFAFLFVARICRGGKIADIIGLTISFSIVILTNLPATVIGALSLIIYSVSMLERRNLLISIIKLSVAGGLILLATSFYWTRMYPELDYFRNTQFWADPTFDWREHFLLTKPSKVVFGVWFNNYTLIATMLLAFCGMAGMRVKTTGERALMIVFFFAVFIMTPLSTPLWQYLPYLKEVQFPGRWQSITSITAAVILGAGAVNLIENMRLRPSLRNPRLWLAGLTLVAFVVVLGQVATKYSRHLIPPKDFSKWCENDINSLGFEFFWTLETKKEAFGITEKIVSPDRNVKIVSWSHGEREFTIEPGPASKVRLATLYYPRWQAVINGERSDPFPDEYGAMNVLVPPDAATVRVWFQEKAYVIYSKYVSAAVWLLLLLGAVYFLISNSVFLRMMR